MMNHQRLKNVLLSNALFSVSCGVIMLSAADTIAQLMGGHPDWIYLVMGAGLLVFAADVAFVATRPSINKVFANIILWADIGWVVGSIALLSIGNQFLSFEGSLIIAAIACVVAIFSVLEHRHIRHTPCPESLQIA